MASQDELAKALLDNPQVQEAMAKAGANAANNPEVQAAIQRAAQEQGGALAAKIQEQGPEMAKAAMDKAMTLANDPEVQAKAKQYAAQAGAMAREYGGKAGEAFMAQIEQGPTGVRFLAFLGSAASCAMGVMTILNPLNAFALMSYIIAVYMFIFSLSTCLFEMPPEYVEKIPKAGEYQEMLMKKCNFLTDTLGRGLFYFYQGTMWFMCADMLDLMKMALAAYLCFIGVLHIAMHYGVMPKDVVSKMKSGYTSVSNREP